MWQKIKWLIARKKVLARRKKLMRNIPQPPMFVEGEDFEQYSERVCKHLLFLNRVDRLTDIAIRQLTKKKTKHLEDAHKISVLFAVLWFAFVIGWYIREFLR